MKVKDKFIINFAKSVRYFLKLTGHKATSLPGKIAYRLDDNILDVLSQNTKFVFVTGTNGKTMTTHFLTNIIKQKYDNVFTNESGSNMIQGIITSLLDNPPDQETIAVLEVDEANLERVSKFLKADYLVLTNIFRDQMDRFGEIYNVYKKILSGIKENKDIQIIANGDLPIFNYDELKSYKVKYYSIRDKDMSNNEFDKEAEFNSDGILCPHCNSILKYKIVNYSSLGEYSCPNCDFKSPNISYNIDKISFMDANFSKFILDDKKYEIQVGGLYNIYNALAALATAKEMGIEDKYIYDGLKSQKNVFGRQEVLKIFGKDVIINLVKNPVGLNQIINLMLLEKNPISLVCLLNDKYADGTDISWIYDSYYEKLKNLSIKDIYVSGIRKKDMKKRLEIADIFNGNIEEFDYESQMEDTIKNALSKRVYILSTYTAMLRLREVLDLK